MEKCIVRIFPTSQDLSSVLVSVIGLLYVWKDMESTTSRQWSLEYNLSERVPFIRIEGDSAAVIFTCQLNLSIHHYRGPREESHAYSNIIIIVIIGSIIIIILKKPTLSWPVLICFEKSRINSFVSSVQTYVASWTLSTKLNRESNG